MRSIKTAEVMPASQQEALGGILLDENSFDILVDEDTDVYKPDGSPLLRYRRNAIDPALCQAAWQNLRDAATPTSNRAYAGGQIELAQQVKPETIAGEIGWSTRSVYQNLKRDGTISKTNRAAIVESGIIGYFDRNPRFPYCRTTAYNLQHPDRFAQALPYIQEVDRVFREVEPARYANQRAMIEKTHPDFVIHQTAFTTVTVNKNWQTAVHKDTGDYAEGFGVLTAFRLGRFSGCYFCLPAYRIAVDIANYSVLLVDVHEWHGNTPFSGIPGAYERISCVFYYRENMWRCGSSQEELVQANDRVSRRILNGESSRLWQEADD